MNIPATFGPICFSGYLEEDWNDYGQTTSDGKSSPDPNVFLHIPGFKNHKN
jgi:hypothetical protein